MKNKIIKFLFSFVLLFNIVNASEIDIQSNKYILYNMNDNNVLLEKDSNDKTYIASLTKIMSVIVSIENIKDYNDKVTVKSNMINDIAWDVAKTGFKANEEVTYNDLLYAAILDSGADAIQILEYSVAGSKSEFVKLMNDKVSELNLKNTHFENAIGLTNEDNYSSAYDLSQILIYALKNDKFKEVFSTKEYTLSNNETINSTIFHYSKNTNYDLSYITGSKTGYTSASGYCLATTANFNNTDYLLITLNAFNKEIKSIHVKDHINIYDYYKKNYGYQEYINKDDVVVKLNTKDSKEKEIQIKSGVTKTFYEKNTFNKDDVTYEYNGTGEISYFTKKGTKLGTVNVIYNNETIDEFDLIYNQELSFSLFEFLKNRWYIFTIIFVIGAIIYKKK